MAIDDRLLMVLRAMNEIAPCTVLELHRWTAIPRPAVYRIIVSLERGGYVQKIPKTSRLRLTSEVLSLSSGYRHDDNIAEASADPMAQLQRQVLWPSSISMPFGTRMVVRETTRYRSPFVFDTGMVGLALPILGSSMGRAYLAFCDPKARKITLDLLCQSADSDDAPARNAATVERLLSQTVRQGFGYRDGGIEPRTSSIAVPLLQDDTALGAICVTYANSVLTKAQAVENFLTPLRTAAISVVDKLRGGS